MMIRSLYTAFTLQCLLVNAVVVDNLYLQLKVVRGASFSQALRLQVHMMDDLRE